MTTKQKLEIALELDGFANFTAKGQRWTCNNEEDLLDDWIVAVNGDNEEDLVLYEDIETVED